MSNLLLFCDIETCPSDTMPELSSIKAPANYKDPDKILAYQKDNQLEQYKKQALDSMEGRIICIGLALEGAGISVKFAPEPKNLVWLLEWIEELQGDYPVPITFVGWNISTFDIPWLWRKAIQYNLPKLRNALPHGNKNMVIDLMTVWAAQWKDYTSLSDCARFLGIPHDDTFTGADVYDTWKAGDLEKIANHCKDDIKTIQAIYGRIYG
jgi:3'-5' exonuclease